MEVDKSDEPEFRWGKKKDSGGNNEGFQFYETFAYDGVEYALNDFVFLYNERREDHPHIGKLIGVWETASKSKIIKVRWLFRASEIAYWLRKHNVKALENEVFLATGQGVGLEDYNDLEALDGKCRVVCISRDSRSEPSRQHIQNADYVLYRTFDVGNYIISENMDDLIGWVEGTLNQVHVPSHSPEKKRKPDMKKDSIHLDENFSKVLKVQDKDKDKSVEVKKRRPIEEPMKSTANNSVKDQKDVKISSVDKVGYIPPSSNSVKRLKTFHQSHTAGNEFTQLSGIQVSVDKNGCIPPSFKPVKTFQPSPMIGKNHKVTRQSSIPIYAGEKADIPPNCKSLKISQQSHKVGMIYEVTRRPSIEKGSWYKYDPWEEENMRSAHNEDRMILLENLDPECTSGEVEDILWSAFHLNCSAKMVQHTAFNSQHYGEALVILRTREAAKRVVKELSVGCLVISSERALTASFIDLPCLKLNQKKSKFFGHLLIDKIKFKREQKDARSTSHHSQANTIEYELALEWCLLQARHDLASKRLFKRQGKELSKYMANERPSARSKT